MRTEYVIVGSIKKKFQSNVHLSNEFESLIQSWGGKYYPAEGENAFYLFEGRFSNKRNTQRCLAQMKTSPFFSVLIEKVKGGIMEYKFKPLPEEIR